MRHFYLCIPQCEQALVVDVELTEGNGRAEREAALEMLEMLERSVCGPATLGADRADDTRDFVWRARGWCVTPHVGQHDPGRRSAIDRRTTRHAGCRQSQRRRKRVEEVFGWIKTIGGGGNLRVLGRARNKLWLELTAAYDLTRLAQLEAAAASPDADQTSAEASQSAQNRRAQTFLACCASPAQPHILHEPLSNTASSTAR